MYKIREAVIVEGTYDLIKLSGFLDAVIIKTNGFAIFHDKKKLQTINTLAAQCGIVILTDSDSAGFKIRNYIKQSIPEEYVKHAYVPDIRGKEKRKNSPSKEGLLGVEGINEQLIITALKNAGCTVDEKASNPVAHREITKADLFLLGLSGGANSSEKRLSLCHELGFPSKISANMLLSALNRLMSYEELENYVKKLDDNT